ncbi:MAG: hypothetical protein K9H64_21330 [Bacteroidales bacterium]|nr:hypothetical protein [Bacteroidales bacterium]MCF8458583.1 hypothetical protein [Bacteroidales bacterium]
MLKKTFIALIFVFAGLLVEAGNENYPVGARQSAMGNAAVMRPDLWSLWHNQAGLGFLKKTTFGLHYENKFIIDQYGYHAFGLAVPSKYGTIGLAISYFGYTLYNEKKFGLAYSRAFGDRFSFGLQIDYLHTHIDQDYGSKGAAVFEAGIMAQPIENLYIGVHVYNPTQVKMAITDEELIPTIYRFGLGYSILDRAFIAVEYEKDIDFETRFKAGIEYEAVKNFYLRTGILTEPFENSFGLGYVYGNIHADIAFTNDPILGLTPHFSMLYSF